ncbi:MAG: phage shock protein PspA [Hyphomicrobiales bacterium]|nr:phage shock protein PspA [Hyphomicrobiales bacterium]MCP5371899.1 phage shock protein PspA [Hyphomicrobiales bacterium]
MGVFTRFADIISSNVNAMLDKAEDPEKMIRLIIQEMEDTLVEVRTTAAKTIADKKTVERKLSRVAEAMNEWQRKAEMAYAKNREDLTRAALIEKSKLAETAKGLEDELEALEHAMQQGETDIVKLQEKLTEAKAKQKTIKARHDTASSRLKVRRQFFDGRIEEAFARFDQVEKRLDDIEGQVESYDLGKPRTLHEELADLEAEAAIEEELAAIRAKMGKGGTGESAGGEGQ